MKAITIGTRGSPLALWQAEHVREALKAAGPTTSVELKIIRTQGDKVLGEPQQAALSKGMFTKEIEAALLAGDIDLAVHSLKDLPTESPAGLSIAVITEREDPADALVSRGGLTLDQLPTSAKVFAGSPRRRAQLLHRRPDLQVLPIRGNVGTRMRKFEEAGADAIVFAIAGLKRLELGQQVSQRLDPVEFPPGCGQGALAIQVRSDDTLTTQRVGVLDNAASRAATAAERAFLAALGGGCLMPAGAYGRMEGGCLVLTGMISSTDGREYFQDTVASPAATLDGAVQLGAALADKLRAAGADEVLREIEQSKRDLPEGAP